MKNRYPCPPAHGGYAELSDQAVATRIELAAGTSGRRHRVGAEMSQLFSRRLERVISTEPIEGEVVDEEKRG